MKHAIKQLTKLKMKKMGMMSRLKTGNLMDKMGVRIQDPVMAKKMARMGMLQDE